MTAYYSVIQYQPDAGRCEAVNIGLLIFREDPYLLHVMAIAPSGNARVQKLFPDASSDLLETLKANIVYALSHPPEEMVGAEGVPRWRLKHLIREMARRSLNSVNCVPFRACVLGNDPQATLSQFFKELVE